jgi:hypothetical protein
MANVESRWIEAISTLNELTQKKEIAWEIDRFSGLAGFGSPRPRAYRAKYLDKWFRLVVTDEPQGGIGLFGIAAAGLVGPYTLEIVDEVGNSLFRIPESSGLKDLYQSVQFQLSGVDEILNSLLRAKQGARLR